MTSGFQLKVHVTLFPSHQKLKELDLKCGSFIWRLWFPSIAECTSCKRRNTTASGLFRLRRTITAWRKHRVTQQGEQTAADLWWKSLASRHLTDKMTPAIPLRLRLDSRRSVMPPVTHRLSDSCLQTSSFSFMEQQKPQQATTATN